MRILFALAVVAVMFCKLHAQQDYETVKPPHQNQQKASSYLAISVGPSIPVGEYASSDFYKEYSFLAQIGGGAQLDVGFLFGTKKIGGIALTLGYQLHKIDKARMEESFFAQAGTNDLTVNTGNLHHIYSLFGPLVSVSFNKVSMDLRVMIGIDASVVPKIDVLYNGVRLIQESAVETGLAIGAGAGVRIQVSDRIFIPIHVDYLHSETDFSGVDVYSNNGYSVNAEFTQKANMIFPTVGIGFNLR